VQNLAEVKARELLAAEIQNSERLNKLEQERAKIEKQRVDYFQQFLFWSSVQLSRTTPALFIMALCGVVGGGLGVFIGLNALPSAIACPTVRSWCYHLRLNKETTLAPEIPTSGGNKERRVVPTKKKIRKEV
jgi:hypothetical protein